MVAQKNEEMANLGKAITQLTSTEVCYVPTLYYYRPKGTSKWEPGCGGDKYIITTEKAQTEIGLEILVGVFQDDAGETYVMVQNVRHKHGSFPINSEKDGTIHIVFDFLNKDTGQVEEIPLAHDSGDTYHLDVTLAAGDPILFKYKTSKPFALQK